MNLIDFFENYLRRVCMVKKEDPILIAVSGGIDSVCLLHLLYQVQNNIAVAHCNFQLRSDESEEDEKFVKFLAEKLSIPYYSKKFKTIEYAQLYGISVQEAARELRYNFFENVSNLFNYKYIAIGHNADDNIETFFINLFRGCGIRGISGIKPINGKIIRPLLFVSREEIQNYVIKHNLDYREDSSNRSDKYLRNRIRHHLLPLMDKINASFRKTMQENILHFQQVETFYQHYIDKIKKEVIINQSQETITFSIEKIKQNIVPELLIYEIFFPLGFSSDTCKDIFHALDGESGKKFYSQSYVLIKDREFLHLKEKSFLNSTDVIYYINENTSSLAKPIHLVFRCYNANDYNILKKNNIAAIDADKLNFPLIIRKWQKGDYFMPLGMKNFKKLSDYFIDNKLSIFDKENVWILANGEEIVWVIGYRIDERYKITSQTQHVMEIVWEANPNEL